MERRDSLSRGVFAVRSGELVGAIADLGVFLPLVAGLVATNGLEPGGVLLAAGGLVLASGVAFRIPFPVQPLKALAAVAIAHRLAPDVIHAAGLEIAAVLLLLSVGDAAEKLSRVFTKPVVRSVQLGVGIVLVASAYGLLADPPAVFAGAATGVAPSPALPSLGLPGPRAFAQAFVLLVIPQLPLTLGNAVVGVTDVAHRYFGDRASRVTPARVCLSCAVGNVASALIGGAPMCHGAGGLTAHYRSGARTAGMNIALGTALVVLGLFFAPDALALLGAIPAPALAALLAYAGVRHALLVGDLRGRPLAVAVAAGISGALTGNLAVTVGVAIGLDRATSALRRDRHLETMRG